MTAWVYLIKATNSGGLHKIGKTENIERRMKELRALPADRICVIELPSVDVMNIVEKKMHYKFRAFRVPQSEMFNLSPENLENCKQTMLIIENNYVLPPPLTAEQKLAEASKEIEAIQRRREALRLQKLAEAEEKVRKAHVERLDEEAEAEERKRRLDETLKGVLSKRKTERRQRKIYPSDFLLDFSVFGLTTCLLATTGIPLQTVLVGGLFAVALYRVIRWVRS